MSTSGPWVDGSTVTYGSGPCAHGVARGLPCASCGLPEVLAVLGRIETLLDRLLDQLSRAH